VAIVLALQVNFFSSGSINKIKCSIFILNKFYFINNFGHHANFVFKSPFCARKTRTAWHLAG